MTKSTLKRSGLTAFFLLTFGYTWGVALAFVFAPAVATQLFGPAGFTNPWIFLAVWSPTLSGLLCALVFSGPRGLKELLGRMFRVRIGLKWWALALLGTAAVSLSARYVQHFVTGAPAPPLDAIDRWPFFLQVGLITLIADPGPLGEDLGWRGFAMPRMLSTMPPLATSLVLGVIWGVWHFPAFFIPGLPQVAIPLHWFLLAITSCSVVMTWMALHTRGAVLPLVLVHWGVNRFSDFRGEGAFYTAMAWTVAALLVIAFTRGRLAGADKVEAVRFKTAA